MKIRHATSIGLLAAAIVPLASAYPHETTASASLATAAVVFPPGVAEVVKLAQSGIEDDVILAYIENARVPYHLSADDIVGLKKAGLSSVIIAAIVSHEQALRTQPRPATYEQRPYAPGSPPTTMPIAPSAIAHAPTVPVTSKVPSVPAIGPPAPQSMPPPAATSATVVEQAPPAPRIEVVPVGPGPDYYWVPGYWTWDGTWLWVSGKWVVRPWHNAVWLNGHWGRHGRGYVWIRGRWR